MNYDNDPRYVEPPSNLTYWDNVNEAICGEMGRGGKQKRAHRIKLWRYRARAAHGGKWGQRAALRARQQGRCSVSQGFELFDCDMYSDDDEPEHVCSCNAMHDDLEHAENLCNACGLMIYDPWAPVQEAARPSGDGKGGAA